VSPTLALRNNGAISSVSRRHPRYNIVCDHYPAFADEGRSHRHATAEDGAPPGCGACCQKIVKIQFEMEQEIDRERERESTTLK